MRTLSKHHVSLIQIIFFKYNISNIIYNNFVNNILVVSQRARVTKFYTKPFVQEERSKLQTSVSVDNRVFLSRYGEAEVECVNY